MEKINIYGGNSAFIIRERNTKPGNASLITTGGWWLVAGCACAAPTLQKNFQFSPFSDSFDRRVRGRERGSWSMGRVSPNWWRFSIFPQILHSLAHGAGECGNTDQHLLEWGVFHRSVFPVIDWLAAAVAAGTLSWAICQIYGFTNN